MISSSAGSPSRRVLDPVGEAATDEGGDLPGDGGLVEMELRRQLADRSRSHRELIEEQVGGAIHRHAGTGRLANGFESADQPRQLSLDGLMDV